MLSPLATRHSPLPCGASRRKAGFTLVEVVTVVMIISILMAATTTAISGARKTAMRTHSRDTVRQLAAAWTAYLTNEGTFPDVKNFEKASGSVGDDTYPASPKNIGGLLNTQYLRNGTPRSNCMVYYDTSKEECMPTKENPSGVADWPKLDAKKDGSRGVCDKWKNVVYFTLDFDLDGKLTDPVGGKKVTASALAYSTAGFDIKDKSKYGKKFLVAY